MFVRCWRPLAFAVVLMLGGGCAGAADSSETAIELTATSTAVSDVARIDDVAVDPCSLVTEAEVEKALSVTIDFARLQSDPLTRAFTFALPERSCEYYGVVQTPTSDAVGSPADPDLPSEPRVDEALEELDESVEDPTRGLLERAREDVDRVEAKFGASELLVGVHTERLSLDEFETYCERRIRELGRIDRSAGETDDLAAAVAGMGSRFVKEATDRATDVGGVGDAARWYPALAQLHVLVGDTAFVVTSFKQSPMMAGMLFDAPVEPIYDPPPEFVDLARLAADRL